ncbi:hypothetical protein vseg_009853 [Gypsophila vaccaria]
MSSPEISPENSPVSSLISSEVESGSEGSPSDGSRSRSEGSPSDGSRSRSEENPSDGSPSDGSRSLSEGSPSEGSWSRSEGSPSDGSGSRLEGSPSDGSRSRSEGSPSDGSVESPLNETVIYDLMSAESEALNIPPLNSMPYVDPIASMCYTFGGNNQEDKKPAEPPKSALMFFPTQPTKEEVDSILSVKSDGVCLGGSAAVGSFGPLVGKVNIGEDADSYLFRVAIPGVAREEFTCDVAPDGNILIKGVTTTGEKIVYKHSMKFEMLTQNLCPPGPFSISFKLPGPVDSQRFTAHFGIDGTFEGLVKKKKAEN